jgi:hypothetical protein
MHALKTKRKATAKRTVLRSKGREIATVDVPCFSLLFFFALIASEAEISGVKNRKKSSVSKNPMGRAKLSKALSAAGCRDTERRSDY